MTSKQKLQKERAWFKYQLLGIRFLISNGSLTESERVCLDLVKNNMRTLIAIHNDQSALLGLKVPEHKLGTTENSIILT